MSGDKKQDRAVIENAARTLANEDYPHFRAAVEYAQGFTTLNSLAFGVVPSGALMPRYTPARDSQVKNLEDGLGRLERLIAGMNEVAYRMAVTEAANTIDLNKTQRIPVSKPAAPPSDSGGSSLRTRLMGTGVYLGGMWRLSAALKSSFAPLAAPAAAGAAVSLLMWAMARPDDDEIGTVKEAWHRVQTELDTVNGLFHLSGSGDDASLLPQSAWDDNARTAFDTWVKNFQTELDKAAAAARDGHDALDDALSAIHEAHQLMREADKITVVVLLAALAASLVPFFTLQAQAAQRAILILNGIVTACTVFTIAGAVGGYGSMMGRVSDGSRFHQLEIDDAPNRKYGDQPVRDTFVDLDVDWLGS